MRNKRGEPVLYMKMKKAIYEMLKSALLFYKKLQHDLEEYGSQVNPYDLLWQTSKLMYIK